MRTVTCLTSIRARESGSISFFLTLFSTVLLTSGMLASGTVFAVHDVTNANTADGLIITDKVTNPSGDPAIFTFAPSWGAEFPLADGDTPIASGFLTAVNNCFRSQVSHRQRAFSMDSPGPSVWFSKT
jgi:hypothetical protein